MQNESNFLPLIAELSRSFLVMTAGENHKLASSFTTYSIALHTIILIRYSCVVIALKRLFFFFYNLDFNICIGISIEIAANFVVMPQYAHTDQVEPKCYVCSLICHLGETQSMT